MQSNVQVTPQMAELGAAIIAAVEMILTHPKEAEAAAQAHLEAHKLNAEQVEEYDNAVDLIKQADALRKELQDQLDGIEAREKRCDAREAAADARDVEHSSNVKALQDSQKAHNAKLEQLEKREALHDEASEDLANQHMQLQKDKADVKKREEAAAAREAAAKEFAIKIGGAAA